MESFLITGAARSSDSTPPETNRWVISFVNVKVRRTSVLLYDVCEEAKAIVWREGLHQISVLSTMVMRNKRAVAEEQGKWSCGSVS